MRLCGQSELQFIQLRYSEAQLTPPRLRRSIEINGHPADLREWGQALLPTQLMVNPVQRFREMRSNPYGPVSVGT
jgi:hypothetical protein